MAALTSIKFVVYAHENNRGICGVRPRVVDVSKCAEPHETLGRGRDRRARLGHLASYHHRGRPSLERYGVISHHRDCKMACSAGDIVPDQWLSNVAFSEADARSGVSTNRYKIYGRKS